MWQNYKDLSDTKRYSNMYHMLLKTRHLLELHVICGVHVLLDEMNNIW